MSTRNGYGGRPGRAGSYGGSGGRRGRDRAGLWFGDGPVEDWAYPHRLYRRERFVIGKWWLLTGYLITAIWRAGWTVTKWSVRHWRLTAPTAAIGWAVASYGLRTVEVTGLAVLTAVTIGGAFWWHVDRAGFDRHITSAVYGRVRWLVVYRRRWRAVMHGCGLLTVRDDVEYVPQPGVVRSRRGVDVLHVRLATGQTPDLLTGATEALRHALGVFRVDAREQHPGWVRLTVYRRDPLTDPITVTHRAYAAAITAQARAVADLAALDEPDPVTGEPFAGPEQAELVGQTVARVLAGVPVAVTEDGRVYRLPVRGGHVLICGTTGSGKSETVHATLRGLAPLIHAGYVTVTGLDPKWMELAPVRGLIDVVNDPAKMPAVLDDLVTELDARCRDLDGATRVHVPSRISPHRIVLVDELATLTALTDRRSREQVEQALGALQSRGRAAGFTVILTTVEPTKDVVRWRGLTAVRVGLRMDEASHSDMALGDGARDRGAYCDRISATTPRRLRPRRRPPRTHPSPDRAPV